MSDTPAQAPSRVDNPLSPDAPIAALLDLRSNPDLATASPEVLRAVIARCRSMTTQAVTLRAGLNRESAEAEGKAPSRVRKPSASSEALQAKLRALDI